MAEEATELLHQLLIEDNVDVEKLSDCLRTLRNICAGNQTVQSQLGQRDALLSNINRVITMGLSSEDNLQWMLCLRICSQFLGNFVVNNVENQIKVWAQCSLQLKRMVQVGDSKLTYVCLMILYNILLGTPQLIKDLVDDEAIMRTICQAGADGVEYSQFIIEHMCNHDVDWSKIYNSSLPINGRMFILDILQDSNHRLLPTALVSQLASQFRRQSDCILRTVADRVDSLEPQEVSSLLRVLASCSPHPPLLQTLQQDRNFIINCAFLLKSIHMAGKEPNNCFSPVAKLAETSDELNQHPAFEFKANLVRVLGNLCSKHKENQDLIRELEIIPILLDCCNIDARNPFIIQWVVLAVKLLCEGNAANQAVIAGLTKEGVVQSALLTEMGLTLHNDGENKIHVAPLRPSTNR